MGSLAILSKSTHALVHIDGLINLQLIITALANKQQQDGVRGKQKKKGKERKTTNKEPSSENELERADKQQLELIGIVVSCRFTIGSLSEMIYTRRLVVTICIRPWNSSPPHTHTASGS